VDMPWRVIALPCDEDVPAPPILAHRLKMLPYRVTVQTGGYEPSAAVPLRSRAGSASRGDPCRRSERRPLGGVRRAMREPLQIALRRVE
jgi:hypothetical protein